MYLNDSIKQEIDRFIDESIEDLRRSNILYALQMFLTDTGGIRTKFLEVYKQKYPGKIDKDRFIAKMTSYIEAIAKKVGKNNDNASGTNH